MHWKFYIWRLRALLCLAQSLVLCWLMFSIEILVQNGSPLSMLSEGYQPYASYKNSAHVSDSGMNEMQPTHAYTLQQEPEGSSRCGMDGNLRESPGTWPGRAFWLGIASGAPLRLSSVLCLLGGSASRQSGVPSTTGRKDSVGTTGAWAPTSGKGPRAKFPPSQRGDD